MGRFKLLATAAITAFAGAAALPAAAQDTPYDLRDLVNARAAGGETAMQMRGYVAVRSETGNDRKWTNWWHAQRRQCVSIATRNGRFDSIVTAPAPDCRAGGRPGRPGWDDRPGRPDRPGWGNRPGGPGWSGGRPISLGLVCFGEGQRPGFGGRPGWQWNERADRYDFGGRGEFTGQQFDASVMIQLWDRGGRIRLPRSLDASWGGRGGWRELGDVYTDRSTIRATYRGTGNNRQRVAIDRRSGRITIQGIYGSGFRGRCDTIDGRDHRF